MKLRHRERFTLKLYIFHQRQLVFIDMRIDDLMVGHARFFAGNLRHNCEEHVDLNHIKIQAKRDITRALRTIEIQSITQQRKVMTVHAGAQATHMKLTWVVKV